MDLGLFLNAELVEALGCQQKETKQAYCVGLKNYKFYGPVGVVSYATNGG